MTLPRVPAEPTDHVCVGPEGVWDCKHPPAFVVAGDYSCRFHLTSVVKLRIEGVRGPVEVSLDDGLCDPYDAGEWATSRSCSCLGADRPSLEEGWEFHDLGGYRYFWTCPHVELCMVCQTWHGRVDADGKKEPPLKDVEGYAGKLCRRCAKAVANTRKTNADA